MDRAKALKKINNLKKMREIVEIAKFDTLQKLAKADKIKDYHYEIAEVSRQVIQHTKAKFHLSNKLSKKIRNMSNVETSKLFVYITIPSNLLNVSYERIEKILSAAFNKETDKVIAIGDPAITFAKRSGYEILYEYETIENTALRVVSMISNQLNSGMYDEMYIVANTDKIKNAPYKIFPIESDGNEIEKYKKTKFYYSLAEAVENISNTYIENIVESIYSEAYRQFYKEKLIRHEGSLQNIDDRIKELKMSIHKSNRKKETEEMIQVSQIIKRG